MSKTKPTTSNGSHFIARPPVVVVMGHIDHGKSTLLDYIRHTTIVDKEVGGITQRMSSYEVIHDVKEGSKKVQKHLTFIDTPGHESFTAIRSRGASAADIAILVVSAEDGVKPQTIDAFNAIKNAALPYIVGISKIDKDNADIERTKQSLAENEIYVEGYGGEIPVVPFSGKTGKGVDDLLDMILLVADVEQFKAEPAALAECVVIEANRDKVRGISATLIIKNGTLKTGNFLVAGNAISPVRIIENFLGKQIKEATPSQPVRVVGWSEVPEIGGICFTFDNKKSAEAFIEEEQEKKLDAHTAAKAADTKAAASARATLVAANRAASYAQNQAAGTSSSQSFGSRGSHGPSRPNTDRYQPMPVIAAVDREIESITIPILIKADTSGSVEALKYEINKLKVERVILKIIGSGVGDISEADVKLASGNDKTLIIGFNSKVEGTAKQLAERFEIQIQNFDIIYKMTEWLEQIAKERAPKMQVEEQKGMAKLIRVFSINKSKQVIGGRVEAGTVSLHDEVKIIRRDAEIGRGYIRELQQAKVKVNDVEEGKEFGAMIESKTEFAIGDKIEAFQVITK